ncbi:response regulator transcription factor [Paenibacillus ferrarius]|uniref:response regulator transcription factor n=1 Tax=Paenibacillus ferrarius TaxID=1469647 RepID=UPI003D2E80C5
MEHSTQIRVIVVEDEELILNNIVKKIQSLDDSFVIMGTAQDGMSALKMLESRTVDVLFTDIQMPAIDGLELLKQVSLQYPHIEKVVISGFNNFDYARQAIKFDVKEYLLKPIITGELEQLLHKIKMSIAHKRNLPISLPHSENHSRPSEEIVSMIQAYLKENFHEEITLESISRHFNFHPSYLSKIFIKHTGGPPSKYLTTIRINHAKYLLAKEKNLSIKDISQRVGYPDPYYFSRIFKQITEKTPKQYRNCHD